MHRIAATPGGWSPNAQGVIIIQQTPASIVFLSAADTDIQTLAAATNHLSPHFPSIRAVNLLQLQQQLSIDDYADTILSQAQVIILRILGGRSYWSYGLEVVKEIAQEKGLSLFILPGDDRPDAELMSHSTVSLTTVNQLWRYLIEGGINNWVHGLQFIADTCLGCAYNPPPPQVVPRVGVYSGVQKSGVGVWSPNPYNNLGNRRQVGIVFYRSHYLSGNTKVIDSLCQALVTRNLEPIAVFVSSLRDIEVQETLLDYFSHSQIILNTTSFAIAQLNRETDTKNFWQTLDVPVLQVILSSSTEEQWQNSFQGLSPKDVAMNIALPEVDGRIITRAISFKSVQVWNNHLETDVVVYQPKEDRINFVTNLAANWVRLKQTPNSEKKIALILANYPNRDGRIANGVGLDTPASCIEILHALQQAGYYLTNIPKDGDELIKRLTVGITNDLESRDIRPTYQTLSLQDYQSYFKTLPSNIQRDINTRWGEITQDIPIAGIQLGNIFIGIQPSRGYDIDPSLNYHAPDLEPTHQYLAYYYWLRHQFHALAIVHTGKHGNLEWLPGKSLSLSSECYPEIALNTLPNFYPFIVNDPGEGSQAKRRAHAVILDHLTPPMTRAQLYGDLAKLETLIDEYYEAQNLDPSRLKILGEKITQLITQTHLNKDLNINNLTSDSLAQFLTLADGYLCELKEAQIRDGLHIFGQCPQNNQLRDLILSIARSPSLDRIGLTRALAHDLNLDFDPLIVNPSERFEQDKERFINCRTIGDAITVLEDYALELIEIILHPLQKLPKLGKETQKEIEWIKTFLLPTLKQTPQEITYLLKGLSGEYIPSGASGAPTRGRPDVLPTGRNFYSVDVRAIPTETAWEVGRKAAETLIERYTQENGEYPKTLAISIWGTSTMRTGGDDVAQVLALMGVKPLWDGLSGRVVGYEILSPSALGRPRVDVTVRVSGFFRDGFPNILNLLNSAINEVACQEEDREINPLVAQVQSESQFWQEQGLTKEQAKERATYRIFGSKPGAYGAGLQGLIESQNWQNDEDLARAYINWSCYAYDAQGIGHTMPEVFQQRLKQLQIVLHNQDNREHDLLDSDDYYQFQGGLVASVRALTGKNPQTYFGDNSIVEDPKVRSLKEEMNKVYRSRVINPKWIAGVMRHGYKGAFEIAATVDYLFAYDATSRCVEDFMYQGVAEAYLFDEKVQQFIEDKNPWALRDIGERLLEAHQRDLWQEVDKKTLEKLRAIVHQAEGVIEGC